MAESPKREAPISLRPRQLLSRLIFLFRRMANFAAERASLVAKFRSLRWISVVLGIGNFVISFLGLYFLASMSSGCSFGKKFPFFICTIVAVVRIVSMVGVAFAQMETAASIANCLSEGSIDVDSAVRQERRVRYRRWLYWTRFGMVITVSQIAGAFYLSVITIKDFSLGSNSTGCFLVQEGDGSLKEILIIFFPALVWIVVIVQCFIGSDVLKWRSFYSTHDYAWKTHYEEVFDHGIREVLCCLGRVKYLSVLEEDEVYSVARLLGDLVAYRASGTGHLELLAGLALLQRHRKKQNDGYEPVEAPEAPLQEAVVLHKFAEAAYTGPLLDFGRNPVLFPCAWLYRQGVLTPWMHQRHPLLEGDNWWRGHAAAFLKYVNMPPEVLLRGRVSQVRREAAYFVVVLHHVKTVVISVRGTETPEDLITDGLGRECSLSADDLDGLLNNDLIPFEVRQGVLSSFPHYGHSGIVESARELYTQIDGKPGQQDGLSSDNNGFLSSLVGEGCECHGYKIRIVGHSLGGAVATMLGIRLYRRHPNLHVYSYGTLPCVDQVVADACSNFVTSIIYSDEFSARLSVNSIIRLRAAAITALSENPSTDSAIIHKIVRRILHSTRAEGNGEIENINKKIKRKQIKFTITGLIFLLSHAIACLLFMPYHSHSKDLKNDLCILESNRFNAGTSHVSPPREETHLIGGDSLKALEESYEETSESEGSTPLGDRSSAEMTLGEMVEMFLPGMVIHIVPDHRSLTLWRWNILNKKNSFRALLADREDFRDIAVTPYMFLDHLPWRCQYAMQQVLEARRTKGKLDDNLLNRKDIV